MTWLKDPNRRTQRRRQPATGPPHRQHIAAGLEDSATDNRRNKSLEILATIVVSAFLAGLLVGLIFGYFIHKTFAASRYRNGHQQHEAKGLDIDSPAPIG